jgi:hypothetical protein
MANEKSKTLIKEGRRTELEDRRPTEKALAAIRRMGPSAALKMCSGLAHQINADPRTPSGRSEESGGPD